MELVLYKVGGSLLDWPEFAPRLRALLQRRRVDYPGELPALLMGGGAAADVVRAWDRCFQLGEATAHQLALTSMELTARLLTELLPETKLWLPPGEGTSQPENSAATAAHSRESLPRLRVFRPSLMPEDTKHFPVLMVHAWIAALEPDAAVPLPQHWGCTSDSIALWLAGQLSISRLILVKSTPAPAAHVLRDWAEAGLVDPEFPRLHEAISRVTPAPSVEWINLRESPAGMSPGSRAV